MAEHGGRSTYRDDIFPMGDREIFQTVLGTTQEGLLEVLQEYTQYNDNNGPDRSLFIGEDGSIQRAQITTEPYFSSYLGIGRRHLAEYSVETHAEGTFSDIFVYHGTDQGENIILRYSPSERKAYFCPESTGFVSQIPQFATAKEAEIAMKKFLAEMLDNPSTLASPVFDRRFSGRGERVTNNDPVTQQDAQSDKEKQIVANALAILQEFFPISEGEGLRYKIGFLLGKLNFMDAFIEAFLNKFYTIEDMENVTRGAVASITSQASFKPYSLLDPTEAELLRKLVAETALYTLAAYRELLPYPLLLCDFKENGIVAGEMLTTDFPRTEEEATMPEYKIDEDAILREKGKRVENGGTIQLRNGKKYKITQEGNNLAVILFDTQGAEEYVLKLRLPNTEELRALALDPNSDFARIPEEIALVTFSAKGFTVSTARNHR